MSFLDSVGDFVSGAAKAVVNTAEDVVGDAAKVAIGVGEAGIQTIGDIVKNPLELLNPFQVISGAAKHLIGDVAGQFASSGGGSSGANAVDNQISSLGGKINDLQERIAKLDPNSKTYASDLATLNFQLQEATQEESELVNLRSNTSKTLHEAREAIDRNL